MSKSNDNYGNAYMVNSMMHVIPMTIFSRCLGISGFTTLLYGRKERMYIQIKSMESEASEFQDILIGPYDFCLLC